MIDLIGQNGSGCLAMQNTWFQFKCFLKLHCIGNWFSELSWLFWLLLAYSGFPCITNVFIAHSTTSISNMATRCVTCPKCNRSIPLHKLNRHWTHSPNHADIHNPFPLAYLLYIPQEERRQESDRTLQQNEERIEDQTQEDEGGFLEDNFSAPFLPLEEESEPPLPEIESDQVPDNVDVFPNAGNSFQIKNTLIVGHPSTTGFHYIHPCQDRRESLRLQRQENKYDLYENSAQLYLAETFARPDIQSKDRIVRDCVHGRSHFLVEGAAFSSHYHFMFCLDTIGETVMI